MLQTFNMASSQSDAPVVSGNVAKDGAQSANAEGGAQKKAKKERIYVPWPAMENTLTALFFIELVYIYIRFPRTDDRKYLLFGLVATAVGIYVVKWFGGVLGRLVNIAMPWKPLSKTVSQSKFVEQIWQLAVHTSMAYADWSILEQHGWYEDSKSWWYPAPWEQEHPPPVRFLMMLQLGIWIYTLIVHRWLDPSRRKDFFEMFIHHVVTIALISGGAAWGYHRVSLVILAVHDTSDILIDCLKITNLLKLEGARGLFIVEIVFVSNLVVWIYFRLWVFPTKIISSAITDFHRYVPSSVPKTHPGEPWNDPWSGLHITMYCQGVGMLLILQVLHIWWTYILLRIAFRLIFAKDQAGNIGAAEYEGDSEAENALHKKNHQE